LKALKQFSPRPGEIYIHTAIRGLAALSVVGYHAMLGSAGKGYTDNILQNFFLTSFLFVDFFFMLSGYIMVESYKDKITSAEPKTSSIKYLKKRAQKILPNYYFWLFIAIFLTILNYWYFGNDQIVMSCALPAVTMHLLLIQNLIGSCYYFNTPLWSIAVEFLAYLAFPILVLIKPRPFVLIGAGLAFYAAIFVLSPTIDLLDGGLSVARCFAGFICGMGGAKLVRRSCPDYVQIFLLVALFLSIAYALQALALLLMWVITVATAKNVGFLSDFSRLKYPYLIGRASFSIYLAHIPVSMVLSPIAYKAEAETGIPFGSDWTLILPIKIIVSGLVGVFAFQQVECRFSAFFERRKLVRKATAQG
jgi:peptidoglycan/LPS O-acetylase OafA/YrhL